MSQLAVFVSESSEDTSLSPPVSDLDRIIERHDKSQDLVRQGLLLLAEAVKTCPGFGLQRELSEMRWYSEDPVGSYLPAIDKAIAKETWEELLDHSRLPTVMSAKDIADLRQAIKRNPPPINRETVVATFVSLYEKRGQSFRKGLVELFQNLCREYRSNEPFKIGKRVILDGALTSHGWNSYSRGQAEVNDLMRVFFLLDGKDPGQIPRDDQFDKILSRARRQGGENFEHDYFEVRFFNNGNLHIWFRRFDLVDKANRLIAEHYGHALADAGRKA